MLNGLTVQLQFGSTILTYNADGQPVGKYTTLSTSTAVTVTPDSTWGNADTGLTGGTTQIGTLTTDNNLIEGYIYVYLDGDDASVKLCKLEVITMKRKGVFRRIINILSTVILLVVIAVVIFVFIARISGNVPSIFEFSIFRVRSDSMTPTLQVNNVILTHKTSSDDIHKNDIVTYLCEKGELAGETITHRVVSDPEIRGGVY